MIATIQEKQTTPIYSKVDKNGYTQEVVQFLIQALSRAKTIKPPTQDTKGMLDWLNDDV